MGFFNELSSKHIDYSHRQASLYLMVEEGLPKDPGKAAEWRKAADVAVIPSPLFGEIREVTADLPKLSQMFSVLSLQGEPDKNRERLAPECSGLTPYEVTLARVTAGRSATWLVAQFPGDGVGISCRKGTWVDEEPRALLEDLTAEGKVFAQRVFEEGREDLLFLVEKLDRFFRKAWGDHDFNPVAFGLKAKNYSGLL